ncbi:MAG: type II toxin-antitoxin system death-on-curing family toxin [Pseudomonadota bacterium]
MIFLTLEQLVFIHESVIQQEELQGLAPDKSLESSLARVDNRLNYGMVDDCFELAALYAVAIARGHCFHDANKRTAANAMDVCLVLNGYEIPFDATELGDKIIQVAQGNLDEKGLAKWLRRKYSELC